MITAHTLALARPADAAAIAEMSRDTIEHGLGWKWTEDRILRCIRDDSCNVVVGRSSRSGSGRVVGFAIMHYRDDEAHLLLFAVAAGQRRRGVGSALLSWLEATALTAGIGIISLEARATNREALQFYRRHGYREVARVPGMYRGREDGLRIAKDLWAAAPDASRAPT